jgi:hypothetical protein
VGHSYAAKEVGYNSAELSAKENILKVSAWIVGLIVVVMGAGCLHCGGRHVSFFAPGNRVDLRRRSK